MACARILASICRSMRLFRGRKIGGVVLPAITFSVDSRIEWAGSALQPSRKRQRHHSLQPESLRLTRQSPEPHPWLAISRLERFWWKLHLPCLAAPVACQHTGLVFILSSPSSITPHLPLPHMVNSISVQLMEPATPTVLPLWHAGLGQSGITATTNSLPTLFT